MTNARDIYLKHHTKRKGFLHGMARPENAELSPDCINKHKYRNHLVPNVSGLKIQTEQLTSISQILGGDHLLVHNILLTIRTPLSTLSDILPGLPHVFFLTTAASPFRTKENNTLISTELLYFASSAPARINMKTGDYRLIAIEPDQELCHQLKSTYPFIDDMLDTPQTQTILHSEADLTSVQMMRSLADVPIKDGLAKHYFAALARALFFTAISLIANRKHIRGAISTRGNAQIVDSAKHIIDQHMASPDLESKLIQIGVKMPAIRNAFRKTLGQTLPQYLRNARLRKAKVLLSGGRISVEEAVMITGYPSIEEFTTDFFEHFELDPANFKMP